MNSELSFPNNNNNSFFDRHNNVLLGSPTHFVQNNNAHHNNNGIYETNSAGDAIPRPRKLRRVSSNDDGEDYSKIRSTDDIIRLRKTHRRSPCLLVGGSWQDQVAQSFKQQQQQNNITQYLDVK
eukprot:CAMPEP_0194156822 /NCGR_PEP_ID=MMETSP0152-20130528/69685_1 /TAXON_ID=1049557 /ORGANISM="Thalassiothrix antarctica, Strain L6-D1" /LENGTH=123 /DNA_ID=CAMNT_0038864779 /DNA_START=46 /DNA_END=417 /DNA_ORIENTATION=-